VPGISFNAMWPIFFKTGLRLGVELECGGEHLITEISRQAAEDLGIVTGIEIYVAIKASAFRRLG
jgi:molybdate transport system ATP-binding protein